MPSQEDIDRIVSEVMRRLAAGQGALVEARTLGAHARLRISDGVVSLSAVEGRLDHVRQLVVSHRSVVTPAVRDVLRKRDIELVRDDASVSLPGDLAPRLVVANMCSANVEHLLAGIPSEVRLLSRSSLSETISTMATELGHDETLGLVVTDAPEAAVCLANRNANVRAMYGLHEAGVKRAVSTIAANVLIVAALEKSVFETRSLLRAFLNTPRRIDGALQATLSTPHQRDSHAHR